MAVLPSAANGGSATATTQKLASLLWKEETVEVETCGRSYWSFLQRARAIDNKQLGNVSAFTVDVSVEEEVGGCVALWRAGGRGFYSGHITEGRDLYLRYIRMVVFLPVCDDEKDEREWVVTASAWRKTAIFSWARLALGGCWFGLVYLPSG